MGHIVIAGAFDTKAEPLCLLAERLRAMGESPITIDTGIFGGDHGCDHSAESVAEAAGHRLADLPALGRADAVSVMSRGGAEILGELARREEVDALVCMGGSNAAVVFTHLTPVLPMGVPKILMATVVAGNARPLVDGGDVILLYPIVDIEGDNSILRAMIERVAHVAAGARAAGRFEQMGGDGGVVGITMYGVTTRCVAYCREILAGKGVESLVFHANGTGGASLESFVAQGLVSAVLDVTISELTDELFGGLWEAGTGRLTGASRHGVPQAVAPGAIDMINFGRPETVPARLERRAWHRHNEMVTLVRSTPEENRRLGEVVAERLGEPSAPTTVLVPMRGVSALDVEGGPFFDPDATAAFTEGVRSRMSPMVRLVELDIHINERGFAEAMVAALGDRG